MAFDKKTVFILGAGASWHYNYPTGAELVKCMIEKANVLLKQLENRNDILWENELPKFLYTKFAVGANGVVDYIENFISRLKHVDPPVIDYFLDWNGGMQDFGQMLIAWELLEREREFVKYKRNENRQRLADKSPVREKPKLQVDCSKYDDNWYRFVLYKILSKCNSADEVINKNHVHFITFNYDVSLETYLFKGLKQIDFMKPDKLNGQDIDGFLEPRILHMYGSIRKNPYQDKIEVLPYYGDTDIKNNNKNYVSMLEKIYDASSDIKTIAQMKQDDELHTKVSEIIGDAEELYILGYGFDELNNDRLGLMEHCSFYDLQRDLSHRGERFKKRIYFTNYGDHNSVNKKAGKLFLNNKNEFLRGKDAIFEKSVSGILPTSFFYCEKSTSNVYDALQNDFDLI